MTSPAPEAVDGFTALPRRRLEAMAAAGEEILECHRVLAKAGANIVSEILKGQGKFQEWNHYPEGDVYDNETHSQYYYHAHRGVENEHGHFHTFLRQPGMKSGTKPVPYGGTEAWPRGKDSLSHLVAIAMDGYGFPTRLFTTNRWVTGEAWYRAEDVCAMLDGFEIDHAYPSWPTNRWLGAMLRLFHPHIVELIGARDGSVARWRERHPEQDVFEDRELEITSALDISVAEQIERVRNGLGRSGG